MENSLQKSVKTKPVKAAKQKYDIDSEVKLISQLQEQLVRDALRYRWLRETQNQSHRQIEHGKGCVDAIFVANSSECGEALEGNDLDKAIDSAITKYGFK